jgi:integrase
MAEKKDKTKEENKEKESKSKTRRGNGEGCVYKRADGRWTAIIKNGKNPDGSIKKKIIYAKSQREVLAKLNEYRNIIGKLPIKEQQGETVEQYAKTWLTVVKKDTIKPTAYDRIEVIINYQIITYLGHERMSDLTDMLIKEQLITALINDEYSFSTIKKAYNALNEICRYAKSHKVIEENPMDEVKMPSEKNFESKEIHPLNDNEITKFKEACLAKWKNGEDIYDLGAVLILFINTGLREGEMLGLTWKSVDWHEKYLHIEDSMIKTYDRKKEKKKLIYIKQKSVKTKSSERLVYLNDTALWCLQYIKSKRYYGEDSPIVSSKNKIPIRPYNLYRTLQGVIKRANIEKCSIHDLRHTFASTLFRRGIDIKTVSTILGHSDVSITYKIYIHIIEEMKKDAVKVVENI